MLGQPKDRGAPVVGAVAADALEHAEPVVERVRQHVDVRLVPRQHAAVEPDLLAADARGHRLAAALSAQDALHEGLRLLAPHVDEPQLTERVEAVGIELDRSGQHLLGHVLAPFRETADGPGTGRASRDRAPASGRAARARTRVFKWVGFAGALRCRAPAERGVVLALVGIGIDRGLEVRDAPAPGGARAAPPRPSGTRARPSPRAALVASSASSCWRSTSLRTYRARAVGSAIAS